MNAPDLQRSRHLTRKGSLPGAGGGFFTRLLAPFRYRLLKRMDAGLACGSIEGHLPGGEVVLLGGREPGPDAVVFLNDWNGLLRVVRGGSIGLYEAWAAGEWSSPDPVQLFDLFMRNRQTLGRLARPGEILRRAGAIANWRSRNSRAGSRRNIEYHYDLGNDFYASWLDETMSYSSAMFDDTADATCENLPAAQRRKNKALLARLDLTDGTSLLEIGCGWGGLAEQALQQADIAYHGVTLSLEQKGYADARLSQYGEKARVTITDYREIDAQYDAIASVEMVEAVGQQYWPDYLSAIARALKPGGRAAIQYIAIADEIFEEYARSQDFIQRYIFPGGMLLSESRFRALADKHGLEWQDAHHFGLDYAETLRLWRLNFEAAIDEAALPAGFDEKFVKLWQFYLMYCEGGFRGGGIDVAQVTLLKR